MLEERSGCGMTVLRKEGEGSLRNRYLVKIRCRKCGEQFTLKGQMRKGQVDTGFKRCLCDNEDDFDITMEKV
jgi:hypothetical protein